MARARVTRITAIAPEVAEVDLAAVEPATVDVVPGQYLSVLLPGGLDRRSYSIASPPGRRDGMTLLVRRRGSTAAFWSALAIGHEIDYDGPRGDFRLDDQHPADAVFIATGVGVAPLFPMMELALGRAERGRVLLFWGLDQLADLFWHERLAELAARPRFGSRLIFTSLGEGFVTTAVLESARSLADATFYLCGTVQMVRDAVDGLTALGIDCARRIRTDG